MNYTHSVEVFTIYAEYRLQYEKLHASTSGTLIHTYLVLINLPL
jgi:hypothetical protein